MEILMIDMSVSVEHFQVDPIGCACVLLLLSLSTLPIKFQASSRSVLHLRLEAMVGLNTILS